MRLVIGGAAQGKLDYVLAETGMTAADICDGGICPLDKIPQKRILNRLHLLVRRMLEAGIDPAAILRFASENENCIFISDEVGCGIVPIDGFERQWREAAGRICCALAQKSARVDRVLAGIATTIKGE